MIRICNVSGWTDSAHMGKCERDNALEMINELLIEHFVVAVKMHKALNRFKQRLWRKYFSFYQSVYKGDC